MSQMSKAMKRMNQAENIVNPRNNGTFAGFALLPMIFGNESEPKSAETNRPRPDVGFKVQCGMAQQSYCPGPELQLVEAFSRCHYTAGHTLRH